MNCTFAFITTNLSTLIIDDNLELIRTLDNTNFDKYEHTDMPVEKPDESPHELTGVEWLPLQIHYISRSWHPVTGSS